MKLILQIAAGTVVGCMVIKATELMLVADVAHSAAEPAAKSLPDKLPLPRPSPGQITPVVVHQPAPLPASLGQWTVVDSYAQR